MGRPTLRNAALLAIVLAVAIGASALLAPHLPGCSERYGCRWYGWRASDVGDLERFPAAPVAAPVAARPIPDGTRIAEPRVEVGDDPVALGELLERSGTLAFLVEHDHEIVWSWYAPGYDRHTTVTSFSVAKSVASLLLARLAEPLPAGFGTPVTTFVPELRATDPGYDELTLAQLASMRSGIRYRDHDLPWGDKPLSYYHPELRRVALELPLVEAPGERFVYNTWNTVLLGVALERIGGAPVAELTSRELWRPLGAERAASWSLDSERDAMAKMESGFNAAPIDFVKLGRLLLDEGRAGERSDGERLLSADYLTAVLEPEPALRVRDGLHYQLGWWLHVGPDGEPWAAAGWGHLGQLLYAFPEHDVVIVRFGRRMGIPGDFAAWGEVLRQVARLADPPARPPPGSVSPP